MTLKELATLRHFHDGEHYASGELIRWDDYSYRTMYWLDHLREHLHAPIRILRGPHPNRASAVDATCLTLPMGQVFMGITRLQECSWGIYTGNSFHLDTRDFHDVPSRWMGFKKEEAVFLQKAGLQGLVYRTTKEWLYIRWNDPHAFAALALLIEIAESKRLDG